MKRLRENHPDFKIKTRLLNFTGCKRRFVWSGCSNIFADGFHGVKMYNTISMQIFKVERQVISRRFYCKKICCIFLWKFGLSFFSFLFPKMWRIKIWKLHDIEQVLKLIRVVFLVSIVKVLVISKAKINIKHINIH